MGAVNCSRATVPDLLGEHEATDAETAFILDGESQGIAGGACVIPLGEANACSTDSGAFNTAATTVVAEATVSSQIDDLTEATETPHCARANATETPHFANVDAAECNVIEVSPASPPGGIAAGHAEHSVPATSPAISSEAASTVSLDPNKQSVPPVLVLCRYLQEDKKAADAKAPAIEQEANAPAPLADIQAAFMNEMAAGTEGHKYDQAEIGRLAEELGSMNDPRAFYTKASDTLDTTDIIPSKKKTVTRPETVKKRAAGGTKEATSQKAANKKQISGRAAEPKRRERLPGCSVKAEIAKHMTQEELDDHEERRERWMKAEMRKVKQREDINQRMDTACHQQ